jgi:HEAT repeat protein
VGDAAARDEQLRRLRDRDGAVRYWAAVGLGAAPVLDAAAERALSAALRDPAPAVRIEAAAALLRRKGHPQPRLLATLAAELAGDSPPAAVHAARQIQRLDALAAPLRETLAARLDRARQSADPYELYVTFALKAALAHEGSRSP